MFLVAVVVLAALAVPLAGGRLGALVEVHLRHGWAIFAALALEIAAMELPGLPEGLRAALLVAAAVLDPAATAPQSGRERAGQGDHVR